MPENRRIFLQGVVPGLIQFPQDGFELGVGQTGGDEVKRGAIASGAICYTISPIHNLESYVKVGKQMKDLGVATITIKDMAGIMGPTEAYW